MKCLVKKCEESGPMTRGLCRVCYVSARYYVQKGKSTWQELERKGLATPRKKEKRALFSEAFQKIK